MSERNRLFEINLDEASVAPASANVEHDRRIALFDLKESNSFAVQGEDRGPYVLLLGMSEGRLVLDVSDEARDRIILHQAPLGALRKIVKDYALICESYNAAIRDAPPSRIEALDMGRRGLHNEAAEVLQELLSSHFTIDNETARRLFTLVCALHVRG
ncbi:UPF0262 family protein [Candidatus Viadribacter manganicus]|uniref:Uncharacterized protein n=1 Tax=Candidatus Viadribacter manganicus TaxID=1759059 RepID=A0A1B1AMB5_9PROT|nr:UPF0262 family protein [Candidatus Viadribacter manganicus]ANP47694.1 hypothetical protein ATE48_18200 [Candidatus Viadribacter manganicus]